MGEDGLHLSALQQVLLEESPLVLVQETRGSGFHPERSTDPRMRTRRKRLTWALRTCGSVSDDTVASRRLVSVVLCLCCWLMSGF